MKKLSFSTEKRRISDLKDFEYNPRTLSKKQHRDLKKSFKKFGYVEICAIDADNTIIAGHQRVHVMKDLGWEDKEIDVRVPNRKLTDKEFKEYLIRSNQNGGSNDWDILANHFDFDELKEWGFSNEELLDNFNFEPEILEEEEEKEAKENVWILGKHQLICDPVDSEDVFFILEQWEAQTGDEAMLKETKETLRQFMMRKYLQ